MGVKVGQITHVEAPPTGKKAIYRLTLASGQRVYVPRTLLESLPAGIPPDAAFVFVERGFLGRVGWVGTLEAVAAAVAAGQVSPGEAMAAGLHADGSLPTLDEALDAAAKSRRR